MAAVPSQETGARAQPADIYQLLIGPHPALPGCMVRTCSGMPVNLIFICPQPLAVHSGYMPGQLTHPGQQGTSGGHIHPVAVTGSIINRPQPGYRYFSHHFLNHGVVIKGPGCHHGDCIVQIPVVDIGKRSEYLASAAYVHHKS